MQAVKGVGAKAPVILESAPGLLDLGTVGDGAIRSAKMVSSGIRSGSTANELYGVFGTKLVAMTTDVGNIEIGTLSTSSGQVQIARGRSHIMIVDGANGYTYDGTTFAAIADLDFPASPSHVVYLDGFFIVNDSTTDNFYISAVEDPTSWNALDFEAAAVAPDAALALAATESLLWIIGDETSQAFYNNGNPDFPYVIVLSATQEVGILAPHSIAESDDGIFYLATTPEGGRFVYQLQGTQGGIISNDEIEHYLGTVTDPAAAYGFIYKQDGKTFYILQLGATTGSNAKTGSTLVYNMKARAWETRELQDGTGWRAGGHGILGGDNIVGSRLSGQYLKLDLSIYEDAGQQLIRRRRSQVMHQSNYNLNYLAITIDVETGVGDVTTPNPILKLRYSNDAGATWSSWLEASLGATGETGRRLRYARLGSGRNRIFEIELSDPVSLTIIAAYAEVERTND